MAVFLDTNLVHGYKLTICPIDTRFGEDYHAVIPLTKGIACDCDAGVLTVTLNHAGKHFGVNTLHFRDSRVVFEEGKSENDVEPYD